MHARFFVVDAWLKPKALNKSLNVYVDDPKGSRVIQKFQVSTKAACGGVAEFTFPLSDQVVQYVQEY